jgi:transposase ISL3 family protein
MGGPAASQRSPATTASISSNPSSTKQNIGPVIGQPPRKRRFGSSFSQVLAGPKVSHHISPRSTRSSGRRKPPPDQAPDNGADLRCSFVVGQRRSSLMVVLLGPTGGSQVPRKSPQRSCGSPGSHLGGSDQAHRLGEITPASNCSPSKIERLASMTNAAAISPPDPHGSRVRVVAVNARESLLLRLPACVVGLVWRKRRWRCWQSQCARSSFTESIPQLPRGARITERLRDAAGAAVAAQGRTITQAARDHGLSWPVVSAGFGPPRCCPPSRNRCRCWVSMRPAGAGLGSRRTPTPACSSRWPIDGTPGSPI